MRKQSSGLLFVLLVFAVWAMSGRLLANGGGDVKIKADGMVESTAGGFKFPDGSIQVRAAAGDGRGEISQADATAGGFPIMITVPGSYILTTNITVPDIDTTAIEITADNVSLDLNGFVVLGPRVSGSGSGNGVLSAAINTSVANGTVSGMGNRGIDVGNFSHVDNIRAINNGVHGIDVGFAARLTNNNSSRNGFDGFSIEYAAVVSGNVAFDNDRLGINVDGGGATIVNNVAHNNADDGIISGNGSVVIGNAAKLNEGNGINMGGSAGYAHNVALGNLDGTIIDGLQMGAGVNVCENVVCP